MKYMIALTILVLCKMAFAGCELELLMMDDRVKGLNYLERRFVSAGKVTDWCRLFMHGGMITRFIGQPGLVVKRHLSFNLSLPMEKWLRDVYYHSGIITESAAPDRVQYSVFYPKGNDKFYLLGSQANPSRYTDGLIAIIDELCDNPERSLTFPPPKEQ